MNFRSSDIQITRIKRAAVGSGRQPRSSINQKDLDKKIDNLMGGTTNEDVH
jgi:hypothetical protein